MQNLITQNNLSIFTVAGTGLAQLASLAFISQDKKSLILSPINSLKLFGLMQVNEQFYKGFVKPLDLATTFLTSATINCLEFTISKMAHQTRKVGHDYDFVVPQYAFLSEKIPMIQGKELAVFIGVDLITLAGTDLLRHYYFNSTAEDAPPVSFDL